MAEFQRESKTFSQVLDFTRGSTGTYFDASGVLQTAAVDEPRFTYDPDTLEAQGLLIEEQRTNLLLWSEAFDDAVWMKVNSSISANSETAPDGSVTADKIIESATTGAHLVQREFTSSNTEYTLTCYVKAGERSVVYLRAFDGSSGHATYFDLSSGTVGTNAAGNTASIVKLPGGFFRIRVSRTFPSTTAALFQAGITEADGTLSYTGDGASGAYFWGAQLEQGSFPTSYIKTEGSQVTRSADNCSRTLGSEFNASEGRVEVTATANIGDTVIALGTESIVADVDTEKTYTMTYNTDPSATTLDIMPGATGTVKSVKYSPRETA